MHFIYLRTFVANVAKNTRDCRLICVAIWPIQRISFFAIVVQFFAQISGVLEVDKFSEVSNIQYFLKKTQNQKVPLNKRKPECVKP